MNASDAGQGSLRKKQAEVILVTGHSGAGLATAIKALEDLGYYCIDNLPFEMVTKTLELLEKRPMLTGDRGIVIGVHIHSKELAKEFIALKQALVSKAKVTLLFIRADEEALLTRFGSSRRKHPLLGESNSIGDAIKGERLALSEVENEVDVDIDTSSLSPHNLARVIEGRFGQDESSRRLFVSIVSFGFKYGLYRPLDSLFDVRFLKNPYFDPALKHQSGLDAGVQGFLSRDSDTQELLKRLYDWHSWVLPKQYDEGKHFYRVGIGCTGGRHRSVFVADQLHKMLTKCSMRGVVLSVSHRDMSQDEIFKINHA